MRTFYSAIQTNSKSFPVLHRLWEIAVNRVSDLNKHAAILYRSTQLYAEEQQIRDHLSQFAPKIEEYVRLQSRACADYDGLMPKCLVTKLIEMKRQGILDEKRLHEHINTFIVAVSCVMSFP